MLSSVIEEEPGYFAGQYLRLVILSSLGDFDSAISEGQDLADRYPDNLEVAVPSRAGGAAEHANWKLNGSIRIRTQDRK